MARTLTTASETETSAAGREFARSLSSGAVTSPTFTLIQEYRGGRLPLFHVDLYRLRPVEVDDLGLEEMTFGGGVTAIEWPDRLPRPFAEAITVRFAHVDESTRTISIEE